MKLIKGDLPPGHEKAVIGSNVFRYTQLRKRDIFESLVLK